VNTALGATFTTIHFLCNLGMSPIIALH
jgi:hypothetical protein